MEKDLQTLFYCSSKTFLLFSHSDSLPDLSHSKFFWMLQCIFSTFMNFILFYMCKTVALKIVLCLFPSSSVKEIKRIWSICCSSPSGDFSEVITVLKCKSSHLLNHFHQLILSYSLVVWYDYTIQCLASFIFLYYTTNIHFLYVVYKYSIFLILFSLYKCCYAYYLNNRMEWH